MRQNAWIVLVGLLWTCLFCAGTANAIIVGTSVLDENFDSTAVGNKSLPADWNWYWAHTYGGVSADTSVSGANSMRIHSPSWGHSMITSPVISAAGSEFGFAFDFYIVYGDDFPLFQFSETSWGSYGGLYIQPAADSEKVEIYNWADELVMTVNKNQWYNLKLDYNGDAYDIYLDDVLIGTGTSRNLTPTKLNFGPGGADPSDTGNVYYDNIAMGAVLPDPPKYNVGTEVLEEYFDTTPVGDDSVPAGWVPVFSHSYIGVSADYWWRTAEHSLQVTSPSYGHGYIKSPSISAASTTFGVQADFRAGDCVNYMLMAINESAWGTFGKVFIETNGSDDSLLDIKNDSGELLASVTKLQWHNLIVAYDGGEYNVLVDDQWIGSGTSRNVTPDVLIMGPLAASSSDKGTVYYDNLKVGSFVMPPLSCEDVIAQGVGYLGDVTDDCTVDMQDLSVIARDWLDCTIPNDPDCDKLTVTAANTITKGTATIDAVLDEWGPETEWVMLDQTYDGSPSDITSAKFAARWDDATDKIFAAIVINDAAHYFEDVPANWNTSDHVEIYSQGDNVGGGYDNTLSDRAQQYLIGKSFTSPGGWVVWPDDPNFDGDPEPGFDFAVAVNGNEIVYEVAVTMYDNYAGRDGATGDTVVTQLDAGDVVRFDIVALTCDSSGSYNGMVAANTDGGKYNNADSIAQYTLIDETVCGAWGYYDGDADGDCEVNLGDFSELGSTWMHCFDPNDPSCDKPWE